MSLLLTKQIAELFIMILLGFILVKSSLLTKQDSKVLSTVALYIINPCVIINAFQVQYSQDVKNGIILSFLAAIIVHIIYIVGARMLGKVYTLNGVEKATIIYTNAGNLIIPLVQALLGKEWVVYTTGYILVSTIFIWTHGRMLICEETGFNVKELLKNVNVVASIIGILMFALKIQLPSLITETMDSMSATIAPISMIVAGMLIAGMDVKDCLKNKRLYIITFLKMIVFPLLAVCLLKFSSLSSMAKNGDMILLISLLASVAPTAASVTQIAQIYDADSEYASAYYFITTLLCILTMPFFVWIYQY
ncbi:AEC family transporter [uncultured Holdemanella sp.]|uniref:AEC family transporter n=1 Tax=uncultured Holdemanella sp. TaxID=1763549 RepID=UPI0025EF790A|nr:AEC family transporter [uncultured Holdemanella sp.]